MRKKHESMIGVEKHQSKKIEHNVCFMIVIYGLYSWSLEEF